MNQREDDRARPKYILTRTNRNPRTSLRRWRVPPCSADSNPGGGFWSTTTARSAETPCWSWLDDLQGGSRAPKPIQQEGRGGPLPVSCVRCTVYWLIARGDWSSSPSRGLP